MKGDPDTTSDAIVIIQPNLEEQMHSSTNSHFLLCICTMCINILLYLDEEQTQSKTWLVTGRSPENVLIDKWKICFGIRKDEIESGITLKDLLKSWPILSTPLCPLLVSFII